MANIVIHDFYCIKCGQKSLSIPRNDGRLHGKFHRKKLYCFHCGEEINCIECRNEDEVREFKKSFNKGEFIDEAEESLANCRDTRVR